MSSKKQTRGLVRSSGTFLGCLRHFLTPQLFKQAHAAAGKPRKCRWQIQPLLFVLCTMTWCSADSLPERFETARAFYVSLHDKRRRPGKTSSGFFKALCRLPVAALRVVAAAVRRRLLAYGCLLHSKGGWAVFGCDGTELACPRTAELEQRLGPTGGKPGELPPVPQVFVSAMVHLRSGVLWSWFLGKGVANERLHLRALRKTLPASALVVADCGYQGYELASALSTAPKTAFLIRCSSLSALYIEEEVKPGWDDLVVQCWTLEAQKEKKPPVPLRLLRIKPKGGKHDVFVLTNVLEAKKLTLAQAEQFYRMRWGCEGFFRLYKRTVGKVKLLGRTVKEVHREAEGSLLAVQLLLAQAAQARLLYGHMQEQGSGRCLLLEVRREILEQLCGKKRDRTSFQQRLAGAWRRERQRRSSKVKRVWPTRGKHKHPQDPKLRILSAEQKEFMRKVLSAA
jgi:hypothetical protein